MTREEQLVFGFFMTYIFNSYVGVKYVDQDAVSVSVSEKTLTTPTISVATYRKNRSDSYTKCPEIL